MPQDDISKLLPDVRRAFLRRGLEAPAAILLRSREEGMKFLSAWHQSPCLVYGQHDTGTEVVNPDGSVWMEAMVMGVSVRWPAERYITSRGAVWR